MFSFKHIVSALLMIMALLWLTISTPFIYAAQQAQQEEVQKQSGDCEDNNPFSNTIEEKNESSVNTLSEYLHDPHLTNGHFINFTRLYKCHPSDLYYEYHIELLSPPPEV
jgi:hypothetical protein